MNVRKKWVLPTPRISGKFLHPHFEKTAKASVVVV
jgi:hypothetical protein